MSKAARLREKAKKEAERLKKAAAKEERMKNPGGGSGYAAKGRRIAKGDQPKFALNPDIIAEEPEIDDGEFLLSDLFSDWAEPEVEEPIDPDMHHRPYRNAREDGTKLIVSESYKGAGAAPFIFMDEHIEPSQYSEAQYLPCFLVAQEDSNSGLWFVTRYVGNSYGAEGNPQYDGEMEVIFQAPERYGHKRAEMANALKSWCETQPQNYMSGERNMLFGYAPKVDVNSTTDGWGYSETRALPHQDTRFRNTSGRGMARRDGWS